jgi:hypothetical protein
MTIIENPLPETLPYIRFNHRAMGHSHPPTGHSYLRWILPLNTWQLTRWARKNNVSVDTSGNAALDGGNELLADINSYVFAWLNAQQNAIDDHRIWSGALMPNTLLKKTGFRPVKAQRDWDTYVFNVKNETSDIIKDLNNCFTKLKDWGVSSGYPEITPFNYACPWDTAHMAAC